METVPRWYLPVTIVALLWNLLGCLAYLSDVTATPEDVARMSAAQQALYAARPSGAVAATVVAADQASSGVSVESRGAEDHQPLSGCCRVLPNHD